MKKTKINLQNNILRQCFRMGLASMTAVMILGAQLPVYATEYSREITPEMQQNGTDGLDDVTNEDGTITDTTGRISITNDVIYDSQLDSYLYSTDGGYIYVNVLNNMMVQSSVTVTADDGVEYAVYQDGDAISLPESGVIEDAGSYTVMDTRSGNENEIVSFTIVGNAIHEPLSYDLPSTCVATSVTIDGEETDFDNRSIDLNEEGHYVIEYMCVRNNESYSLDFRVDHTAPTLTLNGLTNNKARGKVTLTDYEEGATITIQKDGKSISARTELTQPGSYTVKITDAAGNASVYSFYILFYLNMGGITFGLVTIAAVIAVIVYLYISRKRMRVR